MKSRRLTNSPQSQGPLGLVSTKEAGEHLAMEPHEILSFARRMNLPILGKKGNYRIDFGGRDTEAIRNLYRERLVCPTTKEDFRRIRTDWRALRLPVDRVDESLVEAAYRYFRKTGRRPQLVNLVNLLPFGEGVLRVYAKQFYRRVRSEQSAERWSALPPEVQKLRRSESVRRDTDPDPRLDRWVADRLDCEVGELNAIYKLGLIATDPDGPDDGRRRALAPESIDRAKLRHRLATNPPRVTPGNIRYYRTARTGLGLDSLDDHPPSVFADAIAMVADATVVPSPTVLARILGGDPDQFVEPLIAHGAATGKPVRWARKWAVRHVNPTIADLREAMDPAAPIHLTAADTEGGSLGDAPPTELLRKVFGQKTVDDRTRAGIIALEGLRIGISFKTLERALMALNAILPLMEGLETEKPHHVESVLAPYALLTDNSALDERRRLLDVMNLKAVCEISESWFSRLRPEEKPAAARFRFAWPTGAATLFDLVNNRLHRLDKDAADDRDDRIGPWLEDPDRAMAYIMQKADRTFAFHDEVEACIAHADGRITAGEWDEVGPLHWFHEESFVDIANGNRQIDQRILFSIETWKSKCSRLREAGRRRPHPWSLFTRWIKSPLRRRKGDVERLFHDPDLNENRYAIVVHGVVPCEPGGHVASPHWLDIFKGFVLDNATILPSHLAEERFDALRSTGLNNLLLTAPGGLANYNGSEKRTIARHARETLGEVFIPIHEFTHGTALAAFSASARYDLPERSGELAQTNLEDEKWDSWTDPETGEVYGIFQQIRKMQEEESDFIFSPYTMSVLTRATRMASVRLFGNGEWPLIRPNSGLVYKGFQPSTYVVTDGRDVLSHGDMAALFYILVGGIGVLKPHDVKHLINAIARRENVSLEVRRRWNHHKSAQTTMGYGRESRTEKKDDRLIFLRLLQGRRRSMAALSGPTAVPATPFLTRREQIEGARALAADLAAVYERHGMREAADGQNEIVKQLDLELYDHLASQAA